MFVPLPYLCHFFCFSLILAPKPFVLGTPWQARRFPNRTRSPDLTDHVSFFLSLAPSQFHINALTLSDSILPFFPFPPSPSCPLSSSLDTSPSLTPHGQGSKKDSGRTITFTEDTACLQFSDDTVADVAIETTPLAGLTVAKLCHC